MSALETTGLGKRYGRTWALRDCTLSVPAGSVTALVGPNGAGKTTLLHLAVGLLKPTSGEVRIAGRPLRQATPDLARVAFVAQDKPLFHGFTVAEILRFGAAANPRFDTASARARLDEYGVPLGRKVGHLSGGQQSLVALTLALGKRADLLLLDEPLADLDPLARREVIGALMAAAVDTGATVVLSSHILTDLVDTCDHLLLLNGGRLQLAGGFDQLIAAHRIITGPAELAARLTRAKVPVVDTSTTSRQTTALVRYDPETGHPTDGDRPSLDELVLGYLRNPDSTWLPTPVLAGPAGRDA